MLASKFSGSVIELWGLWLECCGLIINRRDALNGLQEMDEKTSSSLFSVAQSWRGFTKQIGTVCLSGDQVLDLLGHQLKMCERITSGVKWVNECFISLNNITLHANAALVLTEFEKDRRVSAFWRDLVLLVQREICKALSVVCDGCAEPKSTSTLRNASKLVCFYFTQLICFVRNFSSVFVDYSPIREALAQLLAQTKTFIFDYETAENPHWTICSEINRMFEALVLTLWKSNVALAKKLRVLLTIKGMGERSSSLRAHLSFLYAFAVCMEHVNLIVDPRDLQTLFDLLLSSHGEPFCLRAVLDGQNAACLLTRKLPGGITLYWKLLTSLCCSLHLVSSTLLHRIETLLLIKLWQLPNTFCLSGQVVLDWFTYFISRSSSQLSTLLQILESPILALAQQGAVPLYPIRALRRLHQILAIRNQASGTLPLKKSCLSSVLVKSYPGLSVAFSDVQPPDLVSFVTEKSDAPLMLKRVNAVLGWLCIDAQVKGTLIGQSVHLGVCLEAVVRKLCNHFDDFTKCELVDFSAAVLRALHVTAVQLCSIAKGDERAMLELLSALEPLLNVDLSVTQLQGFRERLLCQLAMAFDKVAKSDPHAAQKLFELAIKLSSKVGEEKELFVSVLRSPTLSSLSHGSLSGRQNLSLVNPPKRRKIDTPNTYHLCETLSISSASLESVLFNHYMAGIFSFMKPLEGR